MPVGGRDERGRGAGRKMGTEKWDGERLPESWGSGRSSKCDGRRLALGVVSFSHRFLHCNRRGNRSFAALQREQQQCQWPDKRAVANLNPNPNLRNRFGKGMEAKE
ncbi:hypothetical protein LBMAG56_21650 [Verrucomicrobiota bacterium]|nr:hypothetical protein LBMAG56_21650 [Verrucomicrobiota bacterium]